MRYVSTRDAGHTATLDEAILRGIAPDGGLYVPESFPTVDPEALAEARGLPEVAERLIAPFFAGIDLGRLRRHQAAFLAAALGGPDAYPGAPLREAHRGRGIGNRAGRLDGRSPDQTKDHLQ